MTQSIRNSLDKFKQNFISSTPIKSKQSTNMISPIHSKKQSQLETLINTPINSMINQSSPVKESLSRRASNLASSTIQTTSSIFSFRNILFSVILILLLSFLGFNIFTHLSKGTDVAGKLFGSIFSSTGIVLGDTTKNIVSNTSTGTQEIIETGSNTSKNIVDVASKGTTSGIGILQDGLRKKSSIVNAENNNILTDNINYKDDAEPEPVRTSSLQQGYCFIGKINNSRHCAKVNEHTQCMSGDIYPTRDICVNPNLRA
tara:strand:+ start:16139 stop:16915 length:777 start_codon:yes stop_codon:yes gene_type:complete